MVIRGRDLETSRDEECLLYKVQWAMTDVVGLCDPGRLGFTHTPQPQIWDLGEVLPYLAHRGGGLITYQPSAGSRFIKGQGKRASRLPGSDCLWDENRAPRLVDRLAARRHDRWLDLDYLNVDDAEADDFYMKRKLVTSPRISHLACGYVNPSHSSKTKNIC